VGMMRSMRPLKRMHAMLLELAVAREIKGV
jgi:hypothetical protein